jgi:glc operon protein GlcG
MKLSFLVLASMMSAALLMGVDKAPSATYISHEKVAAALAGGPGALVTAPEYIVIGLHRAASGAAELHEKQTDVYYVTDGEATFVTGGALIGDKVVSPGQRQGTGIQGGEVHHLTKGDVIVIPAGVPHWFKDVPHSVSYLLVKVVKP